MAKKNHLSSTVKPRVSVVIPVLNESATVAKVVRLAKRSPLVGEVLVVDDGSIDETAMLAEKAGARVITSTMLGKGISMEDGMREAKYDIIVYLDGDVKGLARDCIEKMAAPILSGDADFVKAKFARKAGRVTTLTARPLIRTYFPELAFLDQPLGGMVAAKKSLLEQISFENDYGVDIGLLVDTLLLKGRIIEVDIGKLVNRNHPLGFLGEMATQVARALLERAARAGRLRLSYIREAREQERVSRLDLPGLLKQVPQSDKIALFDMDGVLLNGRFITALAKDLDKEKELAPLLDNHELSPLTRMRRIAGVFRGTPKEAFERVARAIPLMPGAVETIVGLRKKGYRVGIVTDSYHLAAETVRRRVFADFTFSHFMRFKSGKAMGKVNICPAMIHPDGCKVHDHCKANVLLHLADRLAIPASQILYVGDGPNDICVLKKSGTSIAFQPKTNAVAAAADSTISSLKEVLALALGQIRLLESGASVWLLNPLLLASI